MAQGNAFAAELQHCLQERKNELSQSMLAGKLHVSPGYLSKVVNGRRPAPRELARKIDGVLGTGRHFERLAVEQAGDDFPPVQPQQLPAMVADFVGRRAALSQLEARWAARVAPGAAKVVVIEGAPGIGKSALLLRFAAAIAGRYGDGCLYADLRHDPSTEVVLNGFLQALGVPSTLRPTGIDGKAAVLRSVLAQRRILVVLDNVSTADQILPLLPGSAGAALVSMRSHAPELYERTGTSAIVVGPFGTAESRELLAMVAGGSRVAAEPAAARRLVQACDGFPGPARQLGELLVAHPYRSVHELAEQLDSGDCLDHLDGLDTTFTKTYEGLRPAAAGLFRLLGLHTAGSLSESAAAALGGLDQVAAVRALDELRAAYVLNEVDGRVSLPGPLQMFAAKRARAQDGVEHLITARHRIFQWYLEEAATANDALAPDWDGGVFLGRSPLSTMAFRDAMSWCSGEADAVLRLARCAQHKGDHEMAWKLTLVYLPYFYLSKRWDVWLHAASVGVSAAREAADLTGLGRCLHSLGWVLHELGKADEALRHLNEGLRIQEQIGDDRGRAWTLLGIGATGVFRGDHTAAGESLRNSANLFFETSLGFGAVVAMSYEARVLITGKSFDDALALLLRALEVAVETGVRPTEGLVRHGLGELHLARGEFRTALAQFDRALLLRQDTGQRWAEAEAQVGRGKAWTGLDERDHARVALKRALAIFEGLHDPRGLDVRALLAGLGSA
ncbi:tetratricopeptide repeat protein [Amycolatopsis magusensis]|uniref:tetratricopeptide repeat protein n=1 Tax=Amycolatopsis magusensis TaxID=882444 RepID=UPI003795A485